MFPRLRHHALVRGHDEQRPIYRRRAGDHRVDEALVPRHIDERELELTLGVGKRREPEHQRDAATLLFGQAVAVHAGECPDERGLAVIDMPGSPEDDGAHASILVARGCPCWNRR